MDQQAGRGINWLNISADDLRKGANDATSRLPFLFERKWLEVMGEVIPCINCKGFEKKLSLLKQNIVKMSEIECQYKLKGKYNGVWGYKNAELTDKKAEKLAKDHHRGHDLFAELPKEIADKIKDKDVKRAAAIQAEIDKKKEEVEQVKADAEKKLKADADAAKRQTMLDKQHEAEKAKAALETEAETRKRARFVELLSKNRKWLIGKAKKLKISAQGETKEIATRIHKNE